MNIDAVAVANHFWKVPGEVHRAMEMAYQTGGILGKEQVLAICDYLNNPPKIVVDAAKRILDIQEEESESW